MGDVPMVSPSLPPYDKLSSAERRWLAMRLYRLRSPGTSELATFAEAIVGDALTGSRGTSGASSQVGVVWRREISVEVKYSRGTNWDVSESKAHDRGPRDGRRPADVYVFAMHDGDVHSLGWSFYVVPRLRIDELGRSAVSIAQLEEWEHAPVTSDGLATAVEWAYRMQRFRSSLG